MKTSFDQTELILAINELAKVWEFEKTAYKGILSIDEVIKIDATIVSYGISLGTLRKIFQE